MSERKRVFLLVLIMATGTAVVVAITIFKLYSAAFEEERARLVETAQSQARLIEAVARFDAIYSRDYPGGAEEATLAQIVDAHEHYGGFGETGEFTLARREGDNVVFLLRHRHFDLDRPKPVAYDSDLAEPMRRALSGMSGTVVGLDYRGVLVLAAHEPVGLLGQGIVAKIDLSEIRAPFLRAGEVAALFALLVVSVGTGLFFRVSNPIIRRLEEHAQQLEESVEALQESEERYRRIVNTAQEGIWVVDAEVKVDYVNQQLADMLGYTVEEILGRYLFDFMDDLSPVEVGERLKGHKWETTGKHDFRFRRKDGSGLWGMVSSSPMFDDNGQFVGALGMIIDVTQRKRAGDALRKSSEAIKLFAYSVAHDLKSPAVGVYGLTKRLRKQYGDILDEKGKDYCNSILEAAEQITELVGNINVYISTREMSLRIVTLELREILQIVRGEFSTQLDIRQVSWKQPEIMPEIRGDRLSILRILRNLVDNAMKYGGDELTEIKIGYKESDQFHIVSVSDDGVGVTGHHAEKLFGVFQRQETSRGVEGIGLGLAIVKELAEQHSGAVRVEPGPEKGATFYVSILKNL
jgi:PAS domain S-box-containing protein